MKRILILLTVLSCIMTVACSSSSEELSKKDEPETEPKDTTNVDTTTTEKKRWIYNIYFYEKPVDVAELPNWIINNADSLSKKYPNGLDVYRTLYERDTVYIVMTATSPLLPIYDKKGNLILKDLDSWFYTREWKRIYSWRPDNWNDSLENVISDSRIFKRTIYIPDELVDTASLPAWTAYYVNYYTKEHPMGLDFYRGEYRNDTIYMMMTEAFDYPWFYHKNGEYFTSSDKYKNSSNWKRIFSSRPENWDDFWEAHIFVLRFFLR